MLSTVGLDLKKTLEKLAREQESPRAQMSIFWNVPLYRRFKSWCDAQGISASRLLEEFMEETVRETQPRKTQEKR